MDRQEARRRVCTEWAETYQYAYNQLKFVADEHARVRAANGLMVTMDKVLPFNAPIDAGPTPEFASADTIAQALKPTTPKTAPEKLTEEGLIGPPYDAEKKRWNYCPSCKTTDINHLSGPNSKHPGAEWQGCLKCRLYLNIDNQKAPMPPQGRSR